MKSSIYVGFPRISQHHINNSKLIIESLVLSAPTATSFHLLQNATTTNGSPYHPRLDSFNASISLSDHSPYGYIQIPKIHATARATSIVDQEVQITDLAAFTEYTKAVLGGEEVKVIVKGRTKLHEMKFPDTTVDYDKTVTMKGERAFSTCWLQIDLIGMHSGLNKLAGFNVTEFSIKLTPEPDGTNMIGTVYIPNPTVMTISMVIPLSAYPSLPFHTHH